VAVLAEEDRAEALVVGAEDAVGLILRPFFQPTSGVNIH